MLYEKQIHRREQCEYCKNNYDIEIPDDIINAIHNEKLVVFAGAGVSTERHTVFINTLYEDVKQELEIRNDMVISFSQLMSKYCEQSNGRAKLLQKIKDRFDYINSFPELYRTASEFHKELSTLYPIDNIITTNWDDYFEKECGATPMVNAEDFVFWDTPDRKVFKLHGSINNYGSIIASEEDYKRCYRTLQNGLIGSYLKMVLATKIVLFIGYSFTDEDFMKIYGFLKKETKDLLPHSYIVTIDKNAVEKFKDMNITPIVTDATYFISILKKHLVDEKKMLPDERFEGIYEVLLKAKLEHIKLDKELNCIKHPEVLFATHYQDGLIHAFERILAKMKTGYYSNPQNVLNAIQAYEGLRKEKLKKRIYHDVAYIDGYITGLIYFLSEDEFRESISFYYAFGVNHDIETLEDFTAICNLIEKPHKSSYQYAKRILKEKNITDEDIIIHHTPFL
jgi:NAD-dependent SIR2 family protein deacetylase